MERSTRLRRYSRKDYTQIVEFPVEIVGRDGQVRRYSYDESVRLYQRRIRSAPIRYDDGELIRAETRHCRQRIEQLRRSYVERFGWGGLREGLATGILATPLAAEAVSFLRRVFPGEREGAISVAVLSVGEGDVCWVRSEESGRVYFLYLYRVDADGPVGGRDAWRARVRELAEAPSGEGVERLFVLQEGPDLALLLSGTGEWDGPAITSSDPWGDASFGPDDGDAWQLGQRAIHEGAVTEAVRLFELGMEQTPLRRTLPQAAALLALLDNQAERAEYAARFGCVSHPDDPLLRYLLGVALARRGRADEATAALAAFEAPPSAHLSLLAGLLALRAGRLPRGLAHLLRAGAGPLVATAERARRGVLLLFLPLLVAASGVGVVGFIGLAHPEVDATNLGALVTLLLSVGLAWVTARALRLRADQLLLGAAPAELRLVSLELMPRERPPEVDN